MDVVVLSRNEIRQMMEEVAVEVATRVEQKFTKLNSNHRISVNQAMKEMKLGYKKIHELMNSGVLKVHEDGKIFVSSIDKYQKGN